MKKRIHNWLVKSLLKSGQFSVGEIDRKKKRIFLGLFGITLVFLEPKQRLAIAVLIKWYGYKCYETTIKININL
jgi:hypothetical protein